MTSLFFGYSGECIVKYSILQNEKVNKMKKYKKRKRNCLTLAIV